MADHGGETTVIDEDLIRISCEEERAHEKKAQQTGGAEVVSAPLTIPEIMRDVTTLRLSFKNINKIDNLVGFSQLTKLCLDNNAIEEVVGLDHLVNLRWLDLSFNRIAEVQGLGTLTKLEDLSLYNNQIAEIKQGCGLENCTKLTCLSLGNNRLFNIERLLFLRRFTALRMLNLTGNPVCDEDEYRFWVLAHIKGLKYLDFALVHERDVERAKEQFQDELLGLEEREGIDSAAQQREAAARENTAALQAANLGASETLFESMFADDPDHEKLKQFPGQADLHEAYREGFTAIADVFRAEGLKRHAAIQQESAKFEAALSAMQQEATTEVLGHIRGVEKRRKRAFRAFEKAVDVGAAPAVAAKELDGLDADARALSEQLVDLEVQQGEKTQELVDKYENELIKFRTAALDDQGKFFRAAEDLETHYHEELEKVVVAMLEKAGADGLDDEQEDVDEGLRAMLGDRDLCMNMVVGSNDIHMTALLAEEDRTRDGTKNSLDGMVQRHVREEELRRRKRGMEIKQMEEHFAREVADKLASLAEEDDDDDL